MTRYIKEGRHTGYFPKSIRTRFKPNRNKLLKGTFNSTHSERFVKWDTLSQYTVKTNL